MVKKLKVDLRMCILLLSVLLIFAACDDFPGTPSGPDDATLSGLSVSTGTLSPDFAPGIETYSLPLADTVTEITLTPTATNSSATITVNGTAVISGEASGALSLSGGINTINIVVTAEDGTTEKTYTISAVVGGVNLSGTLTLPNGEDASGKDFHLGLITDFDEATEDTRSIDAVWTSGSNQTYQLTGVPEGTYYLYAIIDWNNDGDFDDGYPDYAGLSGFTFDSLNSLIVDGTPPGDANIIVADSNLTADITDIQQIPASDGTITVSLTGAGDENGEVFLFYVYNAEDTPTPSNHVATGSDTVQAGFVSIVAQAKDTNEDFIGTGGSGYNIFVLIENVIVNSSPDNGEPFGAYMNEVIDGNITIQVNYEDLEPYVTPPSDGTITVSLTGAPLQTDDSCGIAIFPEDGPYGEDDRLGQNYAPIGSDGSVTITARNADDTENFTGTGGTNYDVFVLVDENNNGATDIGEMIYMATGNTVDGDITVPVDYGGMTPYVTVQ
ncbi:MAG: cadherin-like beta sandwich domain-containing protein [Spirochaetales bacterium]|nr:cadherin-like beta sandwich domain-containing protein [Spirochaetales bacterium]